MEPKQAVHFAIKHHQISIFFLVHYRFTKARQQPPPLRASYCLPEACGIFMWAHEKGYFGETDKFIYLYAVL